MPRASGPGRQAGDVFEVDARFDLAPRDARSRRHDDERGERHQDKLKQVRDGRGPTVHTPSMDRSPDPHGQAALMLCQGMLLLFVEKGSLGKDEVASMIEGLIEVKHEMAGTSESVVVSIESIGLLRSISLSIDAASISPDLFGRPV